MLSRTKYQGILVEVDQCVGDIKDENFEEYDFKRILFRKYSKIDLR